MKKKLLTVIIAAALICVAGFTFVACSQTVELESYAANSEVFTTAWQRIRTENAGLPSSFDLEQNINPGVFFTGTEFRRFQSFWLFLDTNKLAGLEFAIVQLEVVSDRDVHSEFSFEYWAMEKHIECGTITVDLKANVPQTISYDFTNTFIVGKNDTNVYFEISIENKDLINFSDAFKAWANTEYKFSKFELALLENAK